MVSSSPTSAQRGPSTARAWWRRLGARWPWWTGLALLLSPIVVAVVLGRSQVHHPLDSARLAGRWELIEVRRPPDGVCLECLASLTLSAPERAGAGAALALATAGAPALRRVAAALTYGGALMGPVTRLDLAGEGRGPCVHGARLPDWLDLELHTGLWRGRDRLHVFVGPPAPRSPGLPPRPQPLLYDRP